MFEIKDLEFAEVKNKCYRSENLLVFSGVLFYQIFKMHPREYGFWVYVSDGHDKEDLIVEGIKTLEQAKQKANSHWRGVLMPFLREGG